ncbi:MAG TPA: hypothetical protein VE733_30835 [Streptosporangiaceae bacterium]|jgi:hypothetical protein|nr:hypothetical protein [Streptosporangiaceae bacterium]
MIEMAASRSFRTEIHIDQGAGRGWQVSWPFGRFVIGGDELTVRSSFFRWIVDRSASKDAVGEISVCDHLRINLPLFYWRRLAVVRFEDPTSALFGVSLVLPRRTQAIDELRARGFSVTDRT